MIDKDRKIQLQMKDLVLNDRACLELGLNHWYLTDGGAGEQYRPLLLSQAKEWGLVWLKIAVRCWTTALYSAAIPRVIRRW